MEYLQTSRSVPEADEMELEMLNLNQICRTCKCIAPQMRPLFEGYENSHPSPRIDEMLMACASVQVMCGDGLPAQICQTCVEQLRNAFVFKRQCEKIDANLREYAKNVEVIEIKQEPQNSDVIESQNTLSDLFNEQSSTKETNQEFSNTPVVPKIEADYIQFLDNDQMLLTCRECSKMFTTIKRLRFHKRVHMSDLYKCSKCDKEYTRLNHLQRHEKSHTRKKVHVCKICNKTLLRMDHLKRHLVTHLKKKLFSCNTCNRVFSRARHLRNHSPRCKRDMVYPCDICNKAFNREESLEMHKRMHEDQPKPPTIESLGNIEEHYYQIDQDVDAVFSDYSDVDDSLKPEVETMESMDEDNKEVADMNLNDEESNVSETSIVDDNDITNDHESSMKNLLEVTKEVKVEDSLETEEYMVKDEDDTTDVEYEAEDILGDTTDSEYVPKKNLSPKMKRGRGRPRKKPNGPLKSLQIKKEEEDEEYREFPDELKRNVTTKKCRDMKKYECPLCPKSFATERYRNVHINGHNGRKEYQCKVCEKTFLAKSHLTEHMKLHNKHAKKFLCSECGQGFIRNDYLVIHMRRHTGEKPFKCKFCGKGFRRTTDLRVHERCHTGEKTHLCTICGRAFGRAYNLTVHTRTHTGEKPYQCTYCDAAFAQRNDLNTHIRRHTGERFQCELCSDSFLMGYLLTQHKRTVHGLNVESNIRGLRLTHKLKKPNRPPPIPIPPSKPVEPDDVTLNTITP